MSVKTVHIHCSETTGAQGCPTRASRSGHGDVRLRDAGMWKHADGIFSFPFS